MNSYRAGARSSVVLMYHAVFANGDTSAIDAEDLPYAVSVSEFSAQLDMIEDVLSAENAADGTGLYGGFSAPSIILTFDDGHASNYEWVAPLLVDRGFSAYFFITTGFIDQRRGFMSRAAVRELSLIPGCCIGSHGVSHRFFNDLSAEDSLRELTESRAMLEDICGAPCQSMSFPGGRFSSQTLAQMRTAGYCQWFGSKPGLVNSHRTFPDVQVSEALSPQCRWPLHPQAQTTPVSRMAIRQGTSRAEFRRMITHDATYFRQQRLKNQFKDTLKRVVGNRFYHGLYQSLSAR